jgi:hypothetical protein
MSNFFRDGGFGMFPTAGFGFFLVIAAVLVAVRPERRYHAVWNGLAVATVASAFLGTVTGLINTLRFAAAHPEEPHAVVIGCAESLNVVMLGLILTTLSSLGLIIGAVRNARRPATPNG